MVGITWIFKRTRAEDAASGHGFPLFELVNVFHISGYWPIPELETCMSLRPFFPCSFSRETYNFSLRASSTKKKLFCVFWWDYFVVIKKNELATAQHNLPTDRATSPISTQSRSLIYAELHSMRTNLLSIVIFSAMINHGFETPIVQTVINFDGWECGPFKCPRKRIRNLLVEWAARHFDHLAPV